MSQFKTKIKNGSYFVIGVFSQHSYAKRMVRRYRQFKPTIYPARSKGKNIYRVIVGPLTVEFEKKKLFSLRKAGIRGIWKIRIPPPTKLKNVKKSKQIVKAIKPKTRKKPVKLKPKIPNFRLKVEKIKSDNSLSKPKPVKQQAKSKNIKNIIPKNHPKAKFKLLQKDRTEFRAGDVFADCSVCPELIVIPSGIFTLGEKDGGVTGDAPAKRISIPKILAFGRFEITFAQWDACKNDGGCNGYLPSDDGWGRKNRPVTNVNWRDAWAYTAWLSGKTGQIYRLPSEAEWEYAARAGSTSKFWWGNALGINQATCENCGSIYDDKKTAPVGSFSANAFGLYDTAGNMWEWTQDCYSPTSYLKHSAYPKPVTGATNCSRVLRGGSWDVIAEGLRSSFRFTSGSFNRTNLFGFRVVREIK